MREHGSARSLSHWRRAQHNGLGGIASRARIGPECRCCKRSPLSPASR